MSGDHKSFPSLLDLDRARGARWVAGADEAGRGCIAGPLVAAAVLLDLDKLRELPSDLTGLNDSKKLSARRRASLYAPIIAHATRVSVVCRSAQSIDRFGIQWANLGGLADGLLAVSADLTSDVVRLSDGFSLPSLRLPHEGVVGGDRSSAAVAAASIIAKETRDRMMRKLGRTYPGYGFEGHAGYPTPAHKRALAELGPCAAHRRSFGGVADASAAARNRHRDPESTA